MNCNQQDARIDLNNLSIGQRLVFKPALTVLQLGASFYLSELVKPVILPVFLVSVIVVFLFVLKARKQSNGNAIEQRRLPAFALVKSNEENYEGVTSIPDRNSTLVNR